MSPCQLHRAEPYERSIGRGSGSLASAPMAVAGAFFDLDKTLMAGSSGMHFGRAAYRSGMVSRRQMAHWAAAHLRYRLRGSTDADTDALVKQAEELLGGVPERTLRRMVPEMLAGILPRIYPQMIEEVRGHQDSGRPDLHRQRRRRRDRPAAGDGARHGRRRSARATRSTPTAATRAASTAASSTAPARSRRSSASPPTTTSTSTSPGPTPTRSPTCRCSSSSATRSSSIRTRSSRRSPSSAAGA